MKEWGSYLFTGEVQGKGVTRFIHLAPVSEIEEPWRYCRWALHLKKKHNKVFIIGLWFKTRKSVSEHLARAMKGNKLDRSVKEIRETFTPQEGSGNLEDSSDVEQ